MPVQRQVNFGDTAIAQASTTINMTATSGTGKITFTGFNSIDAVISLTITSKNQAGTAADVFQVGSPSGNQIGLSVDGAAGMTLTITGTAYVH